MNDREHMEWAHQELGCWGCFFADPRAVRDHTACCQHPRGIRVDDGTGRCSVRRDDHSRDCWPSIPKPVLAEAEAK